MPTLKIFIHFDSGEPLKRVYPGRLSDAQVSIALILFPVIGDEITRSGRTYVVVGREFKLEEHELHIRTEPKQ